MLMWMVFLHRHKLAGQLTAAATGQHPGREAQLRRLLGVAYLARQVNPARRRPQPRPTPEAHTDQPDHDDQAEQPPDASATQAPTAMADEPDTAPPASRRHQRDPGARRDHDGEARASDDDQPREQLVDGLQADADLPSARRHKPRTSTAPSHEPPALDDTHADHDQNTTNKRPSSNDRARPSAPRDAQPPREQDHDLAEQPPPEPPADEPPSLADELRADQAQRPSAAPGDDQATADDDAEPRA